MKNENTLYWIWLAEKCGPASKQFEHIMARYSDPFEVYMLENEEIEQFDALNDWLKARLCQKDLARSYEILKDCNQMGIDIISYEDERYPERLKQLMDPPIVLYCRGHFPDFNTRLSVGIVGTRKMTEYGKQMAYSIAYELGGARVLTVSGMALGIDGVSACGALAAGGETVAVLGCGVDEAYPKSHGTLMEEICRHGAVISEYPPKESARSYNFPKRNRIISGLCQGVLVVEAAASSGALITAEDAIAQGREVFAVPGKVSDAGAKGPNELIRKGAYTVLSAADIFKHYEFLYKSDYDADSLATARAKAVDVESALVRYGLDYALKGGTPIPEERVYSVKRGKKSAAKPENTEKKSEKIQKKEAGQEAPSAEIKKAPARRRTSSVAEPEPAPIAAAEHKNDTLTIEEMDSVTRRIYDAMPIDKAVSADAMLLPGLTPVDVLTSLSLLELEDLISSLPGGMYIRR